MSAKHRWLGVLFALSCALPVAAFAGEPAGPSETEQLRKQLDDLRARLDRLESSKPAPAGEVKKGDSWTDKVKIYGSLRLRFEDIEEDSRHDRERGRFRMRLGVEAAVHEDVTVGARISTGDDACTKGANVTMDNAFSKKAVWWELAYVDWHPRLLKSAGMEDDLHIVGGKMENPFFRPGGSQLMWDACVEPEGAALKETLKLGAVEPFVIGGAMWVDEREDAADAALYGGQLGLRLNLWEQAASKDGKKDYGAWLTLGGGYYDFTNVKHHPGLFDTTKTYGNTLDAAGNYVFDYNLGQGFAEAGVKVMGVPVVASGDLIVNKEADNHEDTAWLAGLAVGEAKEAGNWRLSWNYRVLQKNSVLGVFNQGDPCGGGTDLKGHQFGLEYVIVKNVKAGVNYYVDKKNIFNREDEVDYRRLQLELMLSF